MGWVVLLWLCGFSLKHVENDFNWCLPFHVGILPMILSCGVSASSFLGTLACQGIDAWRVPGCITLLSSFSCACKLSDAQDLPCRVDRKRNKTCQDWSSSSKWSGERGWSSVSWNRPLRRLFHALRQAPCRSRALGAGGVPDGRGNGSQQWD